MSLYWIDIAQFVLAAVILVPIGVLCAECLAAWIAPRRAAPAVNSQRARLAVLIPAHNEQAGLAATFRSVSEQLLPGDRIVVVADNCTDATASVARQAGATTVIERQDSNRRGKGFALDCGVRELEADPPAVVVMIDADCTLAPNALSALAWQVTQTGRPAQAAYVMDCPPDAGPRASVSALAFIIKNVVRPLGLRTLGLPCLLTGTGMAFPWETIRDASLASGNIVEDMQLGLDLALAGHAPLACREARVAGTIENKSSVAYRQRTRWEHGHLVTIFINTPRLVIAALRQRRLQLLALALEVAVPPIALLLLGLLGALAACFAAWMLADASFLPTLALLSAAAALMACMLLAWARFAREKIPFRTLAAVPFYVIWKIPLYLSFLTHRERNWVRTTRSPASLGAGSISCVHS